MVAKNLPQWFVAGFAVVYLTGYLADFFYFAAIGIPEAGLDVAELKYVQGGLFFWLIFFCLGGLGYWLRYKENDPKSDVFICSGISANFLATVLPMSIVSAVIFNPPAGFLHPESRIAFAFLVIANVTGFLAVNRWIEEKPDERRVKHRPRLALALLLITIGCDAVIFWRLGSAIISHVALEPYNSFVTSLGVGLFGACAFCFFEVLERLIRRAPKLDFSSAAISWAMSMVFLLPGLLYLSLTSYAYVIFPLIPIERGGGNFCAAPMVHVEWGPWDKREGIIGTIIYTSSDTVFVVDDPKPFDSCNWKRGTDFPPIGGIPKSAAFLTINPIVAGHPVAKSPSLSSTSSNAKRGRTGAEPDNGAVVRRAGAGPSAHRP